MALSKQGLKALGLCALVLGLMSFGTGAAHAEKLAHWNVSGKAISSGLLPFIQAEIEELKVAPAGKHLVLLAKILKNLIHILCSGISLINFHFLIEGGSLGKIRFTGCVILVGETVQPACEPHTGIEKGVIETVLLKDLIVLHKLASGEVDDLDELVPNTGETFVALETSEECAVGAKIPVVGKIFLEDCQKEFLVEKKVHLVQQGPLTALWLISKTEEHVATIHGSVNLFLVGEHTGLLWSGTPG